MFTEIVKKVSGTAGEAIENKAYDNLVKRYTEPVAQVIIQKEVEDAGMTLKEFNTYREVKTKIQNNELSIIKAAKEAESLAKGCLEVSLS